jgi:multiple antibiotic resistance protein
MANIGIFIGLTGKMSEVERKQTVRKAILVATVVILGFALLGKPMMDYFGVTIPAFRIAGGILLLVIAFDMMLESHAFTRRLPEEKIRENPAIAPLGIPLLAGPGAITWSMLYMTQAGDIVDTGMVIAAILGAMLLTWLLLSNVNRIYRILGKDGADVITKVMGLVLAGIAIQLVVDGVRDSFF